MTKLVQLLVVVEVADLISPIGRWSLLRIWRVSNAPYVHSRNVVAAELLNDTCSQLEASTLRQYVVLRRIHGYNSIIVSRDVPMLANSNAVEPHIL